MNEELKQIMREILMECYGVDIEEAKCHYSTQNYAFIFPNHPYMIRVSMTPKKSRQEILSELMWVDDLKAFKQTICEPSISLKGKLLEEFEIDDIVYRASMFRTARGNVQATTKMNPMFFICVGELLGGIHHVSTNEREIGMNYKRKSMSEIFNDQKEKVWDKLTSEMKEKITEIQQEVEAFPQELGVYGICHGDFHVNNFFVEANNIWLFDFDGCAYANYMYDIVSFFQSCFLQGYGAGKDCREVLEKEMLPYFRVGYELNHKPDEEFWSHLELFMKYRTAFTLLMLLGIDKFGAAYDMSQLIQFFQFILLSDSILDGMTVAMKGGNP